MMLKKIFNSSMNKALEYFNGDDLAANVWQSKYAAPGEETPDDMHHRLAREFARIEAGYIKKETDKTNLSEYGKTREDLNEEKIYGLFKDFKYVVPQGSVMATLGTDILASLSNCWVVPSPFDSYPGILKTDGDLVGYYKRRGGVGVNISTLRPKNASTNNTAKTTTGAVSFMDRFSNTTREVAMNGRRGALMISIHINHPDVLDFVKIKSDKTKVTGANISVQVTDEFINAVKNDEDFILRFPIDADLSSLDINSSIPYNELQQQETGGVVTFFKKVKAKEYWNELITQAKDNAEPGLMYWDRVLDYDPAAVYDIYKPVCSNPCVTADTLVLTPHGYKRADSIKVGDNLLTTIGVEPVKEMEVNKKVQTYTVKLSDGGVINVTEAHQFHARKKNSKFIEEVMLKDLRVGDSIRVALNIDNIIISKNDLYYKGLKEGILLGDGCITHNGEQRDVLKIATSVDDIDYNNNIKRLFGIENFNKDYIDEGSKSMSMSFKAKAARHIYQTIGFTPNLSYDKDIDITIRDYNEIIGLLDGLLATDGNVNMSSNHPQIRFYTSSERLSKKIRLMLLMMGCHGRISESNGEGGTINGRKIGRKHTKYTVSISGESFRRYATLTQLESLHKTKYDLIINALSKSVLSGNNWSAKIVSIEKKNIETVYDFYCEKSDTWFTDGYVSRGCGEQFLNANDSCRLMAYNLLSFVENPFTPSAKFDYNEWYKVVYEGTRLGDALVDLEAEYIDRIINKIKSDPEPDKIKEKELSLWEDSKKKCLSGRRMGMGITAMADTIAALGMSYDSVDSIETIGKIMKKKELAELDCSIDLSILRHPFDGYNVEIEYPDNIGSNSYYRVLSEEFPEQVERMKKYGRRNVNISTIAPTGSVSILTQTTSGIEPLFKAYYIRRKKINADDKGTKVDFVDNLGDSWTEFPVLHPQFKGWISKHHPHFVEADIDEMSKDDLQQCFEESPWYGSEAEDIDWIKRVDIQAMAQKYTSNAISSTLNLPKTVTHEKVSEIYMKGWEKGLKGQTVYVDGSRSGVLVSSTDDKTEKGFHQHSAPKRPKELPCFAHKSTSKGVKYSVIVGFMDNKPYEIFITEGAAYGNGVIKKLRKGHYVFEKTDTDRPFSEDITANMSLEQSAITRLASGMLRHGADVKYVMEQLDKCSGNMFDFTGSLKRVLSKYIKGESGAACPNCGEESLIMEESCMHCTNCGFSACS